MSAWDKTDTMLHFHDGTSRNGSVLADLLKKNSLIIAKISQTHTSVKEQGSDGHKWTDGEVYQLDYILIR